MRVVVAEEDAPRARALLLEAADPLRSPDEGPEEPGSGRDPDAGTDDVDEDDEAGAGKLTPFEAEAWARKTRTLAFVGIGILLVLLGAVLRATAPPAEVRASERAQALLRQACAAIKVGVAVHLAAWILLTLLRRS